MPGQLATLADGQVLIDCDDADDGHKNSFKSKVSSSDHVEPIEFSLLLTTLKERPLRFGELET
jgi:hypothetical protein